MKQFRPVCLLLICFIVDTSSNISQAQLRLVARNNVVVNGSVRCYVSLIERSDKPANLILVNLFSTHTFSPNAVLTNEDGFFSISVPRKGIQKNRLILEFRGIPSSEPEIKVFPLSAQSLEKEEGIILDTMFMGQECHQLGEEDPDQFSKMVAYADSLSRTYKSSDSNQNAWAFGFASLASVGLAIRQLFGASEEDPFFLSSLRDSVVIYSDDFHTYTVTDRNYQGHYSTAFNIANFDIGFNFSPLDNTSTSVFWNSAKLASAAEGQSSVRFNADNFFRASMSIPLAPGLNAGVGYYRFWTHNSVEASALTDNIGIIEQQFSNRFQEHVIIGSISYAISDKINFGISTKSINQHAEVERYLQQVIDYRNYFPQNPFILGASERVGTKEIDLDASVIYKPVQRLQVGVSALSILNNRLLSIKKEGGPREVPLERSSLASNNSRSLGIGISYRFDSFNLGVESLVHQEGMSEFALGLKAEPMEGIKLSVGMVAPGKSYSLGFSFYLFEYRYIYSELVGYNHAAGFYIVF